MKQEQATNLSKILNRKNREGVGHLIKNKKSMKLKCTACGNKHRREDRHLVMEQNNKVVSKCPVCPGLYFTVQR